MITMIEIDDLRTALGNERQTLRNLRDTHRSTVDAEARVRKAEDAVCSAIAQWIAQDCAEAEPSPGYWKMHATANRLDAKSYAKTSADRAEELRLVQEALAHAEKKLREVPCVDETHMAWNALPEMIENFVRETWGDKNFTDPWERSVRVLEEAIEFAQANGLTEPFVKILLDRVYSRPVGDPVEEAANLGITLIAWVRSRGVNISEEMTKVHASKLTINREKLRAKQHEKFLAGIGIDVEEDDPPSLLDSQIDAQPIDPSKLFD